MKLLIVYVINILFDALIFIVLLAASKWEGGAVVKNDVGALEAEAKSAYFRKYLLLALIQQIIVVGLFYGLRDGLHLSIYACLPVCVILFMIAHYPNLLLVFAVGAMESILLFFLIICGWGILPMFIVTHAWLAVTLYNYTPVSLNKGFLIGPWFYVDFSYPGYKPSKFVLWITKII